MSGLSAGSDYEDGTVVRRVSAAGPAPALNINHVDLFSPSKLESIFTKDDSKHTDTNETFSFIAPSPTKASPVKATELSSPIPSDLSQGTSIAVHPTKRQSLGTGDYLSEASRVMTILRQGQERKRSTLRRHPSASITPSEIYEGPEHRWLTPTEPEDVSLNLDPLPALDADGNDIEINTSKEDTAGSDAVDNAATHDEVQENTQASIPESLQSASPTRRASVIRSPSKSVNWVENISSCYNSSIYESDEADAQPYGETAPRGSVKRVDWADGTHGTISPHPPSPTCETQIEDPEPFPRVATLPNTPERRFGSKRYNLSPSVSRPLREVSANVAKPLVTTKMSDSGSRQVSDQYQRRFSESQIMRLPPRPAAPTPPMSRHNSMMIRRTPQIREISILNLTPLADFTVHAREDDHPERSFIDERAHERALKQAHGTLALSRDALVQAITDVQSSELFWERIKYLRLEKKDLKCLHSLDEFCPSLDQLSYLLEQLAQPAVRRCFGQLEAGKPGWLQRLTPFADSEGQRLLHPKHSCVMQHNGLLELELRGNKLAHIDFAQSQLDQLKRLDISHNNIERLVNLNFLRKLLDLDVSYNSLRQILPPNRRGPKLLTELGVGHNKLKVFNFQQFPALKCAFLDGNAIVQIKGLCKANKLETISIRHQNSQNDLVNQILCTPNDCRSLALSGNPVADGHLELPDLPQHSLMELELSECNISQVGIGFGSVFPNLRNLNLNYNSISELSDLQGTFRLRRLVLLRNRVRRMRRTCLLLARLPSLAELDLRDNPLTIGFHPPPKGKDLSADAYAKADDKWRATLDENTGMRRRLTEVLLAEHCKNLSLLDGLVIDRSKVLEREEIWRRCEERGVVAEVQQG
ncbi:Septation initiation network scaffold protein cdc11 [Cyphellophora attinorum]|uniref:Septation initiation network scaffold protein cdc11 n=1 Tax=Cyphellophora attinorum TaxID=1664694 RepID=A0A0N1NWM3_9EURO|nr:Septation initiation network scaffold protein cdc11 [Phialophora attinorum]KPI35536.1 Septation initiation network scaffold protein cdc11 [Phialophora attinorum]